MVLQRFIEKDAPGELQGLILIWHCGRCDAGATTWLTRNEAGVGEKHAICASCKGKNLIKFDPSNKMSEREIYVQQALPFIPADEHKGILENLAWTEALFLSEGCEETAKRDWNILKSTLKFWIPKDQYRQKK